LFAERLEKGRFVWPPVINERLHLTPGQLKLLIEGMDWRRTVAIEMQQRLLEVRKAAVKRKTKNKGCHREAAMV